MGTDEWLRVAISPPWLFSMSVFAAQLRFGHDFHRMSWLFAIFHIVFLWQSGEKWIVPFEKRPAVWRTFQLMSLELFDWITCHDHVNAASGLFIGFYSFTYHFFLSCSQSSTNIWRGKCCDCSAFEDRHFRQFQTLISSVDSYLFLVFSWLGECWEFFVQSSCKKTPKMAVAIRQNLAWSTKNVSRWLMCFTSGTAIDIDSELLKNR